MVKGELVNGVISGSTVYKTASGSFTPTGPVTPVSTGLSTISSVVCSMGGAPKALHTFTTATTGSVAGTIVISCFKPTSTSNPTPIAATGSYVDVNWIAVGL